MGANGQQVNGPRRVEVQPPQLDALWADFKIIDNGDGRWLIECRRRQCRCKWSLPIARHPHPGNLLSLVNHAKGHQ